jgi:hypothetical protein
MARRLPRRSLDFHDLTVPVPELFPDFEQQLLALVVELTAELERHVVRIELVNDLLDRPILCLMSGSFGISDHSQPEGGDDQ